MSKQLKKATFAGGCFWCMVKPFDTWDGIHSVISGYTGGDTINPSYEEVKHGNTGHVEAVEITYDPEVITYEEILTIYWRQIDPTDDGGQFHDRGDSYRTAIFYHDDEQKVLALQSRRELAESGKFKDPIVTEIRPASTFYPAEEEHQDFHKKNKAYYQEDRAKSGRDDFIKNVWGEQV
ncbi:peptide-methionine (S)-S-oxide reductase MsrA [Lentibacillus cibarius]|uniref:Peptide methionine sulfoxide reductase MsrA n=1 Tax=Lentibacillus cibarius TaxID=2583219 RepID=A0A549YI46_9BACI|nr:peptide-methionine (S)-S-oxide reductase MsrA [Lentibacillus cibarius]TRM11557.1 peptide-methionine (S)-S-oxide reductase MsrA [Lentibacillus cibarius]